MRVLPRCLFLPACAALSFTTGGLVEVEIRQHLACAPRVARAARLDYQRSSGGGLPLTLSLARPPFAVIETADAAPLVLKVVASQLDRQPEDERQEVLAALRGRRCGTYREARSRRRRPPGGRCKLRLRRERPRLRSLRRRGSSRGR